MSTAANREVPTSSVGPEFFRPDMPLLQLEGSALNPRKYFNEVRLRELADSFTANGIIEPLVVWSWGGHSWCICSPKRKAAKCCWMDRTSRRYFQISNLRFEISDPNHVHLRHDIAEAA